MATVNEIKKYCKDHDINVSFKGNKSQIIFNVNNYYTFKFFDLSVRHRKNEVTEKTYKRFLKEYGTWVELIDMESILSKWQEEMKQGRSTRKTLYSKPDSCK